MTVNDSAYIAVLENKLIQAERNLYEFRQIFTHWRSEENTTPTKDKQGLFPGQLRPFGGTEEVGSSEDFADEEAECVE